MEEEERKPMVKGERYVVGREILKLMSPGSEDIRRFNEVKYTALD